MQPLQFIFIMNVSSADNSNQTQSEQGLYSQCSIYFVTYEWAQ